MQINEALMFIQQAMTDYASTLTPSVRVGFVKMANEAFSTITTPKEVKEPTNGQTS
jgi:hypothetical protein